MYGQFSYNLNFYYRIGFVSWVVYCEKTILKDWTKFRIRNCYGKNFSHENIILTKNVNKNIGVWICQKLLSCFLLILLWLASSRIARSNGNRSAASCKYSVTTLYEKSLLGENKKIREKEWENKEIGTILILCVNKRVRERERGRVKGLERFHNKRGKKCLCVLLKDEGVKDWDDTLTPYNSFLIPILCHYSFFLSFFLIPIFWRYSFFFSFFLSF